MNQKTAWTNPVTRMRSNGAVIANMAQIKQTSRKVGRHWPNTSSFESKLNGEYKRMTDKRLIKAVGGIREDIAAKKRAKEQVEAFRKFRAELLKEFPGGKIEIDNNRNIHINGKFTGKKVGEFKI